MTHVPRILVIGYCYPPTASPEAFVTAKLLRNIPDCEIDVLTLQDGLISKYSDPEMGEYAKGIRGKVFKAKPSWFVQQLCSIPRLPLRPDRWILASKSVRNLAEELLQKKYDCIVTRSQYHSAHLVGLHLKRKHPDLPWIACFSDPWSGSDHQRDIPIFSNYSRRQEEKVLREADRLVFPTRGLLDYMTQSSEGLVKKSSVIPHCFDPTLYRKNLPRRETCANEERKTLYWRIFGSFYGNRQPDVLLKAFQLLTAPSNKRVRIEIFGAQHETYSLFDHFNKSHNNKEIIYMGQVPHKKALDLMQKSNLLIVIDSTELENSFYLPSKIIDYFGSGTDVLSICRPGTVEEITLAKGHYVASIDSATSISEAMENILTFSDASARSDANDNSFHAQEVGEDFLKIIKSEATKN
ncbi:glycosyltransferase [Thalassospira tepidiphila]|jgi:hypothetical protein|uniref:glycosyltransferase n=1 Tax=Thalassospira tepidiphila TaxID=393657 RepID=UPI001BCE06BB|nr:glycosyltransferase [Thalassospira tepidiphila]MBS8273184.1 glycosyltransferase [Thalassospira tepidiphila]